MSSGGSGLLLGQPPWSLLLVISPSEAGAECTRFRTRSAPYCVTLSGTSLCFNHLFLSHLMGVQGELDKLIHSQKGAAIEWAHPRALLSGLSGNWSLLATHRQTPSGSVNAE